MGNNEGGVLAASTLREFTRSKTRVFVLAVVVLYTLFLIIGSPGEHHFAMKAYPCASSCHDPKCVSAAAKPPETSLVLTLPGHVKSVNIALQDPLGIGQSSTPLVIASLPASGFTILVMPSLAQTMHNEDAGICDPQNGIRRCLILNAELGSEQHAVVQVPAATDVNEGAIPSHLIASFPSYELLQTVPTHIPIQHCDFAANGAALMSAERFIRRCIAVTVAKGSSKVDAEIEPFMAKNGFNKVEMPGAEGRLSWEQDPQVSWTPSVLPRFNTEAELNTIPVASKFQFPANVKRVVVDIGLANKILQPKDPDTWVIAVEASRKEMRTNKLSELCARFKNCILLHSAISNSVGFLQFFETSRIGGSSVDAGDPDLWPMDMGSVLSPVIPLRFIMEAIPDHIDVVFCKTDTNGNDHKVLRSAGPSIARCHKHLRAEFINNGQAGKACQEESAIEFMETNGFSVLWKEHTLGIQTKPWRDIMWSFKTGAPHTGPQDMDLVDYRLFVKDKNGGNTDQLGISN